MDQYKLIVDAILGDASSVRRNLTPNKAKEIYPTLPTIRLKKVFEEAFGKEIFNILPTSWTSLKEHAFVEEKKMLGLFDVKMRECGTEKEVYYFTQNELKLKIIIRILNDGWYANYNTDAEYLKYRVCFTNNSYLEIVADERDRRCPDWFYLKSIEMGKHLIKHFNKELMTYFNS